MEYHLRVVRGEALRMEARKRGRIKTNDADSHFDNPYSHQSYRLLQRPDYRSHPVRVALRHIRYLARDEGGLRRTSCRVRALSGTATSASHRGCPSFVCDYAFVRGVSSCIACDSALGAVNPHCQRSPASASKHNTYVHPFEHNDQPSSSGYFRSGRFDDALGSGGNCHADTKHCDGFFPPARSLWDAGPSVQARGVGR